LSNPYSGLGAILRKMSRTTTAAGFVVLTGQRRGGSKKAGRVWRRSRARTSWWHRTYVEV